jgi:hypothetical protein
MCWTISSFKTLERRVSVINPRYMERLIIEQWSFVLRTLHAMPEREQTDDKVRTVSADRTMYRGQTVALSDRARFR